MKMPLKRLYVGGLSAKVDRQDIGTKFSPYGSVCNVDLKEKTDGDGNIITRFAYVNLEADSYQIEECIKQLNQASWLGSQLKVEPAKESFLDRLKRERASQPPNQYSSLAEEKPDKKKQGLQNNESHRPHYEDKIKRSREKSSLTDIESLSASVHKKKKVDGVEKDILSSFKDFSSVWADSDSEDDKPSVEPKAKKSKSPVKQKVSLPDGIDNNSDSDSTIDDDDPPLTFDDGQKPQRDILHRPAENSTNRIRRYDPTSADSQQNETKSTTEKEEISPVGKDTFVEVGSLKFGESSSFSLLAQFSQQREKEKESTKDVSIRPVPTPKSFIEREQKEKSRPFFIAADDPLIDESIAWMAQSLTDEIREEFTRVHPEIKELYKKRSARAVREERNRRGQGTRGQHQQGRNRGRGRNRGQLSDRGNINFSKDTWWRENK